MTHFVRARYCLPDFKILCCSFVSYRMLLA